VTLREGGVSRGPWGTPAGEARGLNLGDHCGDDPVDVSRNRAILRGLLPAEPRWLQQVHGTDVLDADLQVRGREPPVADAVVSVGRRVVLAVMTADCLPVLLTNRSGSIVGVAHAGWRGLCAGILERTVDALSARTDDHRWLAWLGPAIGPQRFEVGDEVREAFVSHAPRASLAFRPAANTGKWFADLDLLARQRLEDCGVAEVSGGGLCTVSDPARFYSYRRDGITGRMASVIWLD
jgi:YfiH family protein